MRDKLRRSTWTDEDIDAELRRFLADGTVWPSYREFVAAGRGSLRSAVTRRGGSHAWAARVGIEWVERRPGYAPRWTDARVRAELELFLANRTVWPSRAEFEGAGLKLLRDPINRLGGTERWAAEFGLLRPNQRSGSQRVWDDERIEQTIGPLVQRLGRWPTTAEFHHEDLASALTAVYTYGGVELWSERLGAASGSRERALPRSRFWSDERIERELQAYCRERVAGPGSLAHLLPVRTGRKREAVPCREHARRSVAGKSSFA